MAKTKESHPLHDLMDMVTGRGRESDKASWPVVLLLLGALVLSVSVLGIRLALSKRKASELGIKLRRAEESRRRAEEDAKLIENRDERAEAWKQIKNGTNDILRIKARLISRMQKHERIVHDLQAVTGWDEAIALDNRGRHGIPADRR